MTDAEEVEPTKPRSGGRIAAYVAALIVLVCATAAVTFMALFMGYSTLGSSLPPSVLVALLWVARVGPGVIAVWLAIRGVSRLSQGKSGWGSPALGVPLVILRVVGINEFMMAT